MSRKYWQVIGNVSAVTMLEYALVASLVSIVGMAVLTKVGTNLSTIFENIATGL